MRPLEKLEIVDDFSPYVVKLLTYATQSPKFLRLIFHAKYSPT